MKKSIYKYISIILCAIMLSNQILFGCLTVRTHAEENAVQWLQDHFNDAVSAIGGAVFNTTVDCWNAWKTLLGLNDEELEDFIINGVSVGGDGNVSISDDVADSIKDFVNDYKENNQDFRYGHTDNITLSIGNFTSRSRYDAVLQFLKSHKDNLCLYRVGNATISDPTSSNDYSSVQIGGVEAFYIIYCPTFSAGVINNISSNTNKFQVYSYNDDWNRLTYGDIEVYGFASSGDTSLSRIEPVLSNGIEYLLGNTLDGSLHSINFYKNTVTNGGLSSGMTLTSVQSIDTIFPMYRTSDIMKQYSVGNLPYYIVPTNPNVNYANGSYNVTTTQLDNSLSYGDITSYVDSNNVTNYETVINYINNYYNSGGGSGGSGSGGSGSDIDWSWLGRIGEVIGGLISALGNVIAGVIDAIASLIESLTFNLPNTLGQLIAWLMPFLPEEITALLGAFFMVVVIIGVIKLLRR